MVGIPSRLRIGPKTLFYGLAKVLSPPFVLTLTPTEIEVHGGDALGFEDGPVRRRQLLEAGPGAAAACVRALRCAVARLAGVLPAPSGCATPLRCRTAIAAFQAYTMYVSLSIFISTFRMNST
jgi:hypothetical protein